MAKKLGVMAIHGMGDPEPGFAQGMFDKLRRRLGTATDDVEFEVCYWSPILQKQQDVTWRRIQDSGKIDAKALRRFIISALGDPATYLSGYFKKGQPVYADVHECVRSSLARLEARMRNANAKPLVVLAHSLGSVIVSNYLWDEEHADEKHKGVGTTPFERMETMTGLISYGSNIPLFLPPAPPVVCVQFPHPAIPAKLASHARWQNLYDPDDILGYPLAKIWDETNGTKIEDSAINVGLWPLSETPLSHTAYGRDDDFLDVVEQRLKEILAIQ
ncbi:MAG TPA: hypothetical protein VGD79_04135 [Thermoanaerobaculia bacterium]|jgi:hypothetical protein